MRVFISKDINDITYWKNILETEKWKKYSIPTKKKIIIKIFKCLSENIHNNVKKIKFYDKSNNKDINMLMSNGAFSIKDKIIYINQNLLNNEHDGYKIYNIIAHELYHSYQDLNDNCYEEILNNNKNLENKKINNLYITPIISNNKKITDLSLLYYHLNKYEREAFIYGDIIENLINDNKNRYVNKFIKDFKGYYQINLDRKEIFKLIDDCFFNIYHNINPSNNLEATIMYDIYVLAMYNSNIIDNIKLINLLKNKNKAQLLEKEGYEIFGDGPSNSLAENCKDIRNNKENSLKLLKSLNLIQLKNNPDFINTMLFYYNKDTLKILKDKNYNIYKINKEINYELNN